MPENGKNILIVAQYYPPHVGGLEIVAKQQAQSFIQAGKNVSVVTCASSKNISAISNEDGVTVHRMSVFNFFDKYFGIPFPILGLRSIFVLSKEVSKANVVYIHDIFYMSSWLAYLFARFYKKPLLLTQHVGIVRYPNWFITFTQKCVYATWGNAIFRYSKAIVVYNKNVRAFLIGRRIDPSKIVEIRNGINLSLFHPAEAGEKEKLRGHFGLPYQKPIALFVGRFVPKKGFPILLRANSSDYDIVFAGSGKISENWRSLPGVHVIGSLDQPELAKLYRTADLFILPTEGEIFTLAMQEAMASGLPIITTDDPGYRNYDVDRNMIAFRGRTSEELKKTIKALLEDKPLLQRMSEYSIDLAERWFNWETNVKTVLNLVDASDIKTPQRKIAIVSDAVYPYNKGGKEKRIYEISTRLVAAGNQVTIYCMQWWNGPKTVQENGVIFSAISPLYKLYAGGRRSIKEAIFFAFNCLKLLNKDFDVIEVDHMPHLVLFPLKLVCLLKGKKMIVTWHEVWGKEYWKEYLGPGIKAFIAYYAERMSAQLPDIIISVSDHTTRSLRRILAVRKPIETIYNGLNMADILDHKRASDGADIVFAGRLLSHKNVDVLLEATALVSKNYPKVSLWVIGEGPERPSLELLAKDLGIEKHVSFLGFLEDQKQLYSIMEASKMFVLPSTREGFGIAALEANACGIPVITIDHEQNATKDLVVNGENGLLIDLGKNQLAKAIEELLNTNRDRTVYREYAKKYDWDHAALEIENAYSL